MMIKHLNLLTLRIGFEIVYGFQLPGPFILRRLRIDPLCRKSLLALLVILISYLQSSYYTHTVLLRPFNSLTPCPASLESRDLLAHLSRDFKGTSPQ